MSLPKAKLAHKSPGRIRLKVPEKRGDHAFFQALHETLSLLDEVETLEVNVATGGALILGHGVDTGSLVELGEKAGLYLLELAEGKALSPAQAAVEPLRKLDRSVRDFTGEQVDVATLGFLVLLGTGLFQVLRGRVTAPPWYTAFWYAFGLFTKTILETPREKS
ncbi:MAG: hypothetical protein KQJ78_06485 [Deltaproteobacteria bacterium]|nr:hypothetical protein [Deltaproteobacteria bacterium]